MSALDATVRLLLADWPPLTAEQLAVIRQAATGARAEARAS